MTITEILEKASTGYRVEIEIESSPRRWTSWWPQRTRAETEKILAALPLHRRVRVRNLETGWTRTVTRDEIEHDGRALP